MKKVTGILSLMFALLFSFNAVAAEKLTFSASLMGESFDGGFARFSKNFQFNPADLENSSLELTVETGSFYSGDAERDELAVGGEWFAAGQFPKAVVKGKLSQSTAQKYQFNGSISIKGIEKPITFPLSISADGNGYIYKGEASLKRLDFNVGVGEWADTSTIGDEIQISFEFQS